MALRVGRQLQLGEPYHTHTQSHLQAPIESGWLGNHADESVELGLLVPLTGWRASSGSVGYRRFDHIKPHSLSWK